jgi:hypothetical protein
MLRRGPAFSASQAASTRAPGYLCGMCNFAKAAAELSGNGQSCCCSGVSLSWVGQICQWGFLIRWQYAQA